MKLKTRYSRVRFQLTPMKFSDTDEQIEHDGHVLFSRGAHVLGGTEAGGARQNHVAEILSALAPHYGYKWFHHGNCWGAVQKAMIVQGTFKSENTPVIESYEGVGHHDDRGVLSASWETEHLGRMSVAVCHLLTHGKEPGEPNYQLNEEYIRAIAKWGRRAAAGRGLAFVLADMNRTRNAFSVAPFTSFQEILHKNEGTGHGPIDDIAKCDFDGRVEPIWVDSLPDRELRLNTDHFLTEGIAKILWIS